MSEPIVSWRLGDNSDVLERWDIGVIDAGQESAQQEILIWNNFQGAEDVAHMQDVVFTTTDGMSDTTDVVANKWVYVRCDSAGDTEFTQVGGTEKKSIKAEGAEEGVIEGTANTGDATVDKKNFAKITTYFRSDLHGVTAGERAFKLRTEYFYV